MQGDRLLQGRVADQSGRPLADCYVAVSSQAHEILAGARTSADGRYAIRVPEAAQYNVWACQGEGYYFRYIPETKATAGEPSDFRLQPGANIVLAAYDAAGRRLANGPFREAVQAQLFITDLSDAPAPGYFGAVHHPGSDWRWHKAHPAAVVRPGRCYKLFVRWQFDDVGDLLYPMDNAGEGYCLSSAGAVQEINLNLEVARTALAALQRHPLAARHAGPIRDSVAELRAGQAAMDRSPPDMATAVRHFRRSLAISLREQEGADLALAKIDIDKYRKGEVELHLVDGDGLPMDGRRIHYEQIDSAFSFGANPLGLDGAYDGRLGAMMQRAGINQSYVTVRWGQLEPSRGRFDWHNIDTFQRLGEQIESGYQVLGALGLWFSPNGDFTPARLKGAGQSELERDVYRFASELAGRYTNRIGAWEVNELNLASANALDLDWKQRLQIGREFIRGVRDANPAAKIIMGSTALPFEFPDSPPLADVLRAGMRADVVGLEFYYAGVNTSGYAVPGLHISTMARVLDHYADFGKPVLIKEFSAPSTQVAGSSWWKRPWDEDGQAEFAANFYTIAYSRPFVSGITWGWGVTDRDGFIVSGGLVDSQLRPKKAYHALAALIGGWRSRGEVTTGSDGRVVIRGYAGTYRLSARGADGGTFTASVRIEERARNTVALPARWRQLARAEPSGSAPSQR